MIVTLIKLKALVKKKESLNNKTIIFVIWSKLNKYEQMHLYPHAASERKYNYNSFLSLQNFFYQKYDAELFGRKGMYRII